jgi:hypothetical protein
MTGFVGRGTVPLTGASFDLRRFLDRLGMTVVDYRLSKLTHPVTTLVPQHNNALSS